MGQLLSRSKKSDKEVTACSATSKAFENANDQVAGQLEAFMSELKRVPAASLRDSDRELFEKCRSLFTGTLMKVATYTE